MSVKKLDIQSFEAFISGETPAVVDFYADWCGPCRMLAPVLEELADECPTVRVGKINVDEAGELAMRFGISSIPFVALFQNGALVQSSLGFVPLQGLKDKLGL